MRSEWMEGANSSVSEEAMPSRRLLVADKAEIGIDRKTRPRQDAAGGDNVIALKAQRIGKPQPALDAALVFAHPVVVEIALAPFAPHLAVFHLGHKRGVFARDDRLIIIAIQRPRLHLPLRKPAAMQKLMERVQIVIAPRAGLPERLLKLLR